jgi:hypothetical protein
MRSDISWRWVSVVVLLLCSSQVFGQTYIQLILDLSGSMYEKLESGEPKIDAARLVLTNFISELPDNDLNVGLRVYGGAFYLDIRYFTKQPREKYHFAVERLKPYEQAIDVSKDLLHGDKVHL